MLLGIKLIIYDLDGVLIESNPAIRESIMHALDKLELDYDIEEIMERMGTPLNKIFEDLFDDEDQPKIPEAVETYRGYYSEFGKDAVLVQESVFDTLGYFSKNGLTQCIATNSSRKLMEPILRGMGIMDHIDLIIGVEDVEQPKPDPTPLKVLMEKTGKSKEETVFVDDSSTGLAAGKKAGVHTVGITTGVDTAEEITSVDPEFILTSLDQLKIVIKVD